MNTRNNLIFVLADILETNLMDLEEVLKKNGYGLKHETKRQFNSAIHSLRCLTRELVKCSPATQDNFGNDADMLNALILLVIDRTGDDDVKFKKVYDYVKRFKSKGLLTIDDSHAFSHMKK